MKTRLTPRNGSTLVLFLVIAFTAWLMMHESLRSASRASRHDLVFNPGYQHSERLKLAAARAAMDVLAMAAPENAEAAQSGASYRADYSLQRMQIRADSEGLDRWASRDTFRQGLLLEIRASLADLQIALDQRSGMAAPPAGAPPTPLLPALNRAESALSNYSASLTEPANLHTRPLLFARPVLLWWLLILLLVELAALAWLVFAIRPSAVI